MSARSRAASWAQKRAIANPFQAEMPTSPPNDSEASRIRSTSASSPGTISAVPIATPPLAIARPRQLFADVAVEPDGFRKHQPAAAAQPPAVDEFALQHPLAHRRAAEHHDLAQQQRGVFGQIDIDAARYPRPVEQDGFLRQPGEMRAAVGLQRDVELRGRPGRAIDFFRRRRRQRQPRAFAGRDVDIETVAAGDAAGGVDEHGRQALGFRRGKAHAQRAGFMQGAAAGDAVLQVHVERAPRPGRGWPRRSLKSRRELSVRIHPQRSDAAARPHHETATAPSGG